MKVYVAVIDDYTEAPIDAIIHGVATTEEGARHLMREFFSEELEEFFEENADGTYEQFSSVMDEWYTPTVIHEFDLFEDKLIHTSKGELLMT